MELILNALALPLLIAAWHRFLRSSWRVPTTIFRLISAFFS
jgi:hypothetical protein